MREAECKEVGQLGGLCDEAIGKILASGLLDGLKKKMAEVIAKLPEEYSVDFNMNLSIFDSVRDNSLALVQRGLTCQSGMEPYEASGHARLQRYMVDGEISVVPQDHCPHCWGIWESKFENKECFECGFQMGREVKLLLDSNTCPRCEKGTVSRTNPRCAKCGEVVDETEVAWG